MVNWITNMSRRMNSAKGVADSPSTSPTDASRIRADLSRVYWGQWGLIGLELGFLYSLYRRGVLAQASRFFWKEALAVGGIISFDLAAQYQLSEWFWRRNRDVVRRYALQKEQEFFALGDQADLQFKKEKESRLYE